MLLTQQRQSGQDPSKFPFTQLAILALVRLAEPIALTSIFPYAWKLVLHFEFGDEQNASLYAGILISAFALAESLTGMYWGDLSDRIGRKPVLVMGCIGTMLSLLLVGLSTNFWMALAARFLGGALNGNIGVIQTMVGELVVNPKHEPKAFAIMPFIWSVGTIIGPSIGGYFAHPAKNFPDTFAKDSIFGHFPYLLPNLICAGLMLVSIIFGWILLEETHPDKCGRHDIEVDPLVVVVEAARDEYGTFCESGSDVLFRTEKALSIFTPRVSMLIIALGFLCWHSMTYDHLLPIFLQDRRAITAQSETSAVMLFLRSMDGGLGLTTQQTGIIMSVNGLIALFIQAVVFPFMADFFGIWKALVIVTIGHPLAYFVVPFLAMLPQNWLFSGIYACLSLRSMLSIVAYPLLLILIKEASPSPKSLGKINGLAAAVGAASRTLASPISGFLYGLGMNVHFVAIAWWASAFVAVIGIAQLLMVPRRACDEATIGEVCDDLCKNTILVDVEEVDSGYNSAEERTPLLA